MNIRVRFRVLFLLFACLGLLAVGCQGKESDADAQVKKVIRKYILEAKDVRISDLTKEGMEELGPYAENLRTLLRYSYSIIRPAEMKKEMDIRYTDIRATTDPVVKKRLLDSSARGLEAASKVLIPLSEEAMREVKKFGYSPEIQELFEKACEKMVVAPAKEVLGLHQKAMELIEATDEINDFILEHPADAAYTEEGLVTVHNPAVQRELNALLDEQERINNEFVTLIGSSYQPTQ